MQRVRTRPQHGGEMFAGARMGLAQERFLLLLAARPAARHHDFAPVSQMKPADVERISEGMFRELGAARIVDRAAIVGAHGIDLRHRLAKARQSGGLHHGLEPGLQRLGDGAAEHRLRVERNRSASEAGDLERSREAANAWPADLAGRLHIGGCAHGFAGEAFLLRSVAPRRALLPAKEATTGKDRKKADDHGKGQNATRHAFTKRAIG